MHLCRSFLGIVQMSTSVLQDSHMILQPRSGSKEERRVSTAVTKVDRGALLEEVAQDFYVGPGGCKVLLSSSALHAETQSCITRQIVSPHRLDRVKDKSHPRTAGQRAAASCVALRGTLPKVLLVLWLWSWSKSTSLLPRNCSRKCRPRPCSRSA